MLAAPLFACAATSGSIEADEPTVVRFSYDSVTPQTARITGHGNVSWVNAAGDSTAFVVLPESMAAAFACEKGSEAGFHRTADGYQSDPLTSFESEGVELPCPPAPGTYDYEVWIMGRGFGETDELEPEQRLPARLVVE